MHPPNWLQMSAGQKAAWTRRANRAAGIPPTPHHTNGSRAKRPLRVAPKVDTNGVVLEALAKLEDALCAKASEKGVSPALEALFARYQKVKALALAPATTPERQNESTAALRLALIEAVKLVF